MMNVFVMFPCSVDLNCILTSCSGLRRRFRRSCPAFPCPGR
jgi:hypothetical protein